MRVWGDRPWNDEGKQLPIVYHAAIGFTAKLNDFDELARFIDEVSDVEGVSISHLDWTLTEKHTAEVTDDVRSKAVADAITKATVYANALGLGRVTAVAVADAGMLGGQGSSGGGEFAVERASMAMKSMNVGGSAELALKPKEIEVSAVIDARFVAS